MTEWFDSQKKSCSNFRKLLQGRIDKANPRCKLTAEENKRLSKLEAIADKLERGENVQNRQLRTWLSDDEGVVRQSLTRIKVRRSYKPMKRRFGTTQ